VNADAALYMPHTATSCAFPCTGTTTVDYPLSNGSYAVRGAIPGAWNVAGQIDFDSSELAYGLGPVNRHTWEVNTGQLATGVYTYFCRIHPSMRGAFEVVPASTAA
jgi:plastocyanin